MQLVLLLQFGDKRNHHKRLAHAHWICNQHTVHSILVGEVVVRVEEPTYTMTLVLLQLNIVLEHSLAISSRRCEVEVALSLLLAPSDVVQMMNLFKLTMRSYKPDR